MTSDVRVRPAIREDAEAITTIARRSFHDTYGDPTHEADLEAFLDLHYRPDIQRAELDDPAHTYLIGEVGHRPVGFALLLDDGDPPPTWPGTRVVTTAPILLSRLYVDPDHVGRGVGSALMGRACEHARDAGHDVIWLTVWDRNDRARAFYDRWGFVGVGETTFLFGEDPQRDLVLMRSL